MALKAVVDSLDGVDESLRGLYAEKDGKYHLAVEGMAPNSKVAEFRDRNVALQRQIEEMTAKYGDIDPDKARDLLAKAQQIEEKKLIAAGEIDTIVANRIAGLAKDHDKAIKAVTAERDAMQAQLHKHLVQGEVNAEAVKAGVRREALEDVMLRADRVFRVAEDRAAGFKGDEPLYGKDGAPLRPAEWLAGLRESAPHLFEPSTGGGAKPGSANQAPGGANKISMSDRKAFLANLDKIASGGMQVVF